MVHSVGVAARGAGNAVLLGRRADGGGLLRRVRVRVGGPETSSVRRVREAHAVVERRQRSSGGQGHGE